MNKALLFKKKNNLKRRFNAKYINYGKSQIAQFLNNVVKE